MVAALMREISIPCLEFEAIAQITGIAFPQPTTLGDVEFIRGSPTLLKEWDLWSHPWRPQWRGQTVARMKVKGGTVRAAQHRALERASMLCDELRIAHSSSLMVHLDDIDLAFGTGWNKVRGNGSSIHRLGRLAGKPVLWNEESFRAALDYLTPLYDLRATARPGVQERVELAIRWFGMARSDLPRVPIDMSCSGPRSIALAVQLADRVTFAVGAAPERLSWVVQTARTAAQEAGRDPDAIRFGAWVNVAIDDDRERAIESLRGGVGTFAHFSGMSDSPTDEQPEILQRVSRTLQSEYDTRRHGEASAPHASHLDDEFIDWFAIAGSPDHVVERLRELVGLGLRHLYFPGALAGGTREPMVATVLPALREHAAAAAGG